jgi:hypothetical protein
MFRVQGLRGMLGYSRGLLAGVFGEGRRAAEALAAAVEKGDAAALGALFAPGGVVERPVGARLAPAEFLGALGAGARLHVEDVTPAGFLAGFRYRLAGAGGEERGVGFLEFDPSSRRIARARFFRAR